MLPSSLSEPVRVATVLLPTLLVSSVLILSLPSSLLELARISLQLPSSLVEISDLLPVWVLVTFRLES